MRGTLLVLIALGLFGCGLPMVDPGDVILPDDDDDSAADDDDSGGVDDDDDDIADDDDDVTNPDETERNGILWVLDRYDLTAPEEGTRRTRAAASFAADVPDGPLTDLTAYHGLPLPGLLLHPDLDPFAGDEGCQVISSADARPLLPDSHDVGPSVLLASESGAADFELVPVVNTYAVEADGAVDSDSFALDMLGGSDWPGSETTAAVSMADLPEDVLPTPGNIGGLAALHVGWIPGTDDRIEIMLVRFASLADESQWQGLRCAADDDGTYTIDASSLAAAGSGEVQASVARAHWTEVAEDSSQGRPHLHTAGVRAVWYRVTVSGAQ